MGLLFFPVEINNAARGASWDCQHRGKGSAGGWDAGNSRALEKYLLFFFLYLCLTKNWSCWRGGRGRAGAVGCPRGTRSDP